MEIWLLIGFILCLICTVWITDEKPYRFGLTMVGSILLTSFFLEVHSEVTVKKESHSGYTVDTIYTIKNGIKQGVTYIIKEKKK